MSGDKILDAAAETFRKRNKVYGDNYTRAGEALAAMFPQGVTLKTADDHNRFQIFNLIFVKLSRYAVQWHSGHKDSIHDAAVYSAILEDIDAKIERQAKEAKPFADELPINPEVRHVDWGYRSQEKLEEGSTIREMRGG